MTCACEFVHKFPCQFPAETELFEFDGRRWCRFHLPLQNLAGNKSGKRCGDNGWEEGGVEWQAFNDEIRALLRAATPWNYSLLKDTRAKLRGVAFPPGFNFSGISDVIHVNFTRATFGDYAGFTGLTFGNLTSFDSATFGELASFEGAVFGDWASFHGATFGNSASFAKVNFQGSIDFSTDEEKTSSLKFRHVDFSNATFTGPCKLENRVFGADSNFNGAVFKDLVEFHGCTFHQGMSFHQTRFLKTRGEDDDATERLERSYRTLKLEMEKLRARNEEAEFFALEMECRRQRGSVPWLERFAATAYKHLSDYGRSIARPLLWLLPLTVFAFLIYRDLGTLHATAFRDESEILEFTLEQMFSPFKVWFSPSEGIAVHEAVRDLLSNYPPLVKFLASLQSLATITLLALFLLALRRRFKMD